MGIENNQTYQDIVKMYDYAEQLVDAVSAYIDKDNPDELRKIEPFIEQIEESVDIIRETYTNFYETGKIYDEEKIKLQEAMANLVDALYKFKKRYAN